MILPNASFSQYITFSKNLNGTNNILVPQGEIWQVVNWAGASSYEYFNFRISQNREIRFSGTGSVLSTETSSSGPIGLILQGPAELISMYGNSNSDGGYFLVFKKLVGFSDSTSTSATSVVIPSSVSGDVDIKLEQSSDNVTWTECLPGTYNSSTVKRFFRLRAVEK